MILANLLGLLLGFALLAKHFEDSGIPAVLPRFLPEDWKGAFVLLVMIFVLSSFLDNIAAAMIGGTMALTVFRGKVHIGYLAAIVAASNAGGAGSVVGDTTTTMMWIAGVPAIQVLDAYVAAALALVIFGIPAAFQQHRYSPIVKTRSLAGAIDWVRVAVVAVILVAAIATNVVVNLHFNHLSDSFPFIGAAVWVAILVTAPLRKPDWTLLPGAFLGSIFLLSLIVCASLMPVERLPAASWQTALGLGFVSAVFDNIPLTALALKQGGYDWGYLAYAVGFGGSMIWFGSSAGVALSNIYPGSEIRRALAAPRLARGARVRDRLFLHARAAGLARRPAAQEPGRWPGWKRSNRGNRWTGSRKHFRIRLRSSGKLCLVPGGEVESPRCHHRRILSPLRLPVPPSRLLGWTTLQRCVARRT